MSKGERKDTIKGYGLLGAHISYSRSPELYRQIWQREGIEDCVYDLYDTEDLTSFVAEVRAGMLRGFNVTIPYKEKIIPLLDDLTPIAKAVGAVNTVIVEIGEDLERRLIGDNTDVEGFDTTLRHIDLPQKTQALIAGSGGAWRAVREVLRQRQIPYLTLSRRRTTQGEKTPQEEAGESRLLYEEVTEALIRQHQLIINCTPLGSLNHLHEAPHIPYTAITPSHTLIDLVYRPDVTLFMQRGAAQGARVINGQCMLEAQAEAAWSRWRSQS